MWVILAIITGLVSGLIGGFLGISGSFIILTLLTMLKITPDNETAIGTTLFILLPPISILAVIYYWKNKKINFKVGGIIMIVYILASGLGSLGHKYIKEKISLILTSLLFFIAAIIFLQRSIKYKKDI